MKIEDVYADLPVLETSRLLLRKITHDDLDDLFAYCSNEEVAKYVTWNTHRTINDTRAFINYVLNQYKTKGLAPWGIEYKENGRLIGTIDFVFWQPQHKLAEIGYAISPDYWGLGLTTEATAELIRFGFERMDLVRIQARCFTANLASSRVMEKAGMSFEGIIRKAALVKGKHEDLKLYSILKEEYKS